jgi:glycosyltransferase involved in cell wall biosynthesis
MTAPRMRVLFLQQQPCARARKYAAALATVRPDIELAFAYRKRTLSEVYGTGDELFSRWWRLGERPARDLRAVLGEFSPDIVHSHNLPDALTVLAIDLTRGRVPVIHDVHDLQSLRKTPYGDGFPPPRDAAELEQRAVEESAALVTVSAELLEEIGARYALPPFTAVFPNYALERDLALALPGPDDHLDGPVRMVYQGTLSTDGGHYDLREIFRELVAQDITLDVYPARESPSYLALALETPGLRYHDPISPDRLLHVLPTFDCGWAGFNDGLNAAHLASALPNKVYEYAGSGLPSVTLPHRALSRLVVDEGLGISVDDVSSVGEALAAADLPELRRGLVERRWRLTFEGNIGRITTLYETLVREPIVGISRV